MGDRTSVNRDYALWYEFNESSQSTAVESGFWTGDHPADAGIRMAAQGLYSDTVRVESQSCNEGEYSFHSSGNGGDWAP